MWKSIFIGWIVENSGDIHFFGSWFACFQPVFSDQGPSPKSGAALHTRSEMVYSWSYGHVFHRFWSEKMMILLGVTSRRIRKPVVTGSALTNFSNSLRWWCESLGCFKQHQIGNGLMMMDQSCGVSYLENFGGNGHIDLSQWFFMFTRAPRVLKCFEAAGLSFYQSRLWGCLQLECKHSWHVLRLGYWLVPLKLLDLTKMSLWWFHNIPCIVRLY